ncbi:MAG TPA: hypothetical protein VL359_20775, partial [bacterium]|nr:hypothetical protein [bacterium]
MRARAAAGIALLVTLALVLVLTFFMSEFFFSTGLEVQALQTYRDVSQARRLARSVFKAVQVALLQDEAVFVEGYGQIQDLVRIAGLPLAGGVVEQLQVVSLDGLYNVNELSNMRTGPLESMRWDLFNNILARISVPPQSQGQVAAPLAPQQIADLFAALTDWVDSDDTTYTTPTGSRGAEAAAYTHTQPLYAIKNGMLERLEEMRLVLGYDTYHLPWRDMEASLAALPKSSGAELYPEKLDVNIASRDEIVRYLTDRNIDDPAVLADATFGAVQT